MIDHERIVVRYKPGSGGETLCAVLDETLNRRGRTYAATALNVTNFPDVFHSAFHHQMLPTNIQNDLGLRTGSWEEMSLAELKSFIARCFDASPDRYKIGKAHHNLTLEQEASAYEPAFVIDLIPARRHCYIPRALMFYKRSLTLVTYPPDATLCDKPQYGEVMRVLATQGWYPGYWYWCLLYDVDIYDAKAFVFANFGVDLFIEDPSLYPGGHFTVSAGEFALDPEAKELHRLLDEFGVEPDAKVMGYFRQWVAGNNQIMDELGLNQHVEADLDLSIPEQIDLLAKAFDAHAHRLLLDRSV